MQRRVPMHSQGTGLLARAAVLGLAAAAVLIATASPAMAAHHDDYKGWFVSLDAAMTQPNSLDQQYANIVDPTTGLTTRNVMDNDGDFTWALKVGYSWGELGGLAVSYWSFDNEDTINATESTNYVYPTVFGAYGYNNGGTYALVGPVDYTATAKTKASVIDLDYDRPMHAGEKLTVDWIAGLRSATFEETRAFDSGLDVGGYYVHQTHHMKSDAFGVKVGARVNFGFTQHFALQGLMAYSFLQANTDGEATQNAGGTLDEIDSSDDHVMGEIKDYDVRAVWTWNAFDFYVGYGGQTWEGLVADPIEGSCCGASGSGRSTRDSIAFNSAHAGVTFRFGGKH
jgi:Legionella pneumophila major outer membrane protein precursor